MNKQYYQELKIYIKQH